VYEGDADTIRVHTYVWRDDGWGLTAVRTFSRGNKPLAVEDGARGATSRVTEVPPQTDGGQSPPS
jgi:hypothetical protein